MIQRDFKALDAKCGAPRTCRPPSSRLRVRKTKLGPVGSADSASGRKSPCFDTTRREFIALVGGGGLLLAAKVKRARGQQPAMPVIGYAWRPWSRRSGMMDCRW